jgi:PAS domain S-box-containing protein
LVFAAAVFIVDLVTPTGMEVWVLYLPVLMAAVWGNNLRQLVITSLVCSAFVVLANFISPPGRNPPWWDVLNRGMGLLTLWLTTILGVVICRHSTRLTELMESLHREIKQHEQTEITLTASEERMRLAVEGGGMGTWDVNLRTGQLVWSDTLSRMFGYEPASGQDCPAELWWSRIHPDDQRRVVEAREQARLQRAPYAMEYRIRRIDGRVIWLAVFGRFHYDETGEAVRFAGVSFDISRRKELERQVVEVAAREQQRVGQELHDGVGQELTGLGLMAGALARGLPDSAPEKRTATRLVAGLDRVHQQVRTLSRGLVPVQVEAKGLAAALDDLATRTGEQTGIPFTFNSPGWVEVSDHTTATELFRIAQEAVSNALRHGQPKHVHLNLLSLPEGLRLSIRDDGVGIQDGAAKGDGTGLHIMKHRAEQIGGVFEVASAEGGGTVVTCTVPGRRDHVDEEAGGGARGGDHPDRG